MDWKRKASALWRRMSAESARAGRGTRPAPAEQRAAARLQYSKLELDGGGEIEVAVDRRWFDPIIRAVVGGGDNRWLLDCFYPLFDLMRPGDRVLDLGGHIGTFSLTAAALGCRVACIEAAPENVALLRASVARNGFDEMRVVHAAATDHTGRLEFLPHGPWGTISNPAAVASPGLISAAEHAPVIVPALTVDGLLAELGWEGVDFLKMDIEGSELGAIRGMARLLAESDGLIIFYESNGHTLSLFDETPASLVTALHEWGYTSYLIEPKRLVPVRPGDFQAECVVNYLAFKGRHPRLAGWRIGAPRSLAETIATVVAECSGSYWYGRAYIARAVREGPPEIAADARVRAALASLGSDPDERVRAAVAWFGGESR